MTSNALFPRFFPVIFLLSLALLSCLLHFNGLYGQDAHEYLRQSRVIFERFLGAPAPLPGIGDMEFAGGYPLAGALFRFLSGDAILALQWVSWLSAALGLWVFELLLRLLAPGARAESRWVFGGLGLALAPMYLRSGLTIMSDSLGLLLVLSAFFFGLRGFESRRVADLLLATLFAVWAVSTRYVLAALLLPLALALGWYWVSKKKWAALIAAMGVGILALAPHFWLKSLGTENPLGHSGFGQWSAVHFFQGSFSNVNGGISKYALPNILFLLFPLMHPVFCLGLPGLWFLFKKTDLILPAKRILLAGIGTYLILLGGIPHQNPRHLLPAYVLLLFLLFPAWDRLYCYGFLFFRRLTAGILITALSVQLICCVRILIPVIARNRLETRVATTLKAELPPNACLFSFDLDVAMRSYLAQVQFQNLWERRYMEFPSGSYVLFNENLRAQWQGLNPILNWDFIKEHQGLELRAELPEGWRLWKIQ